MKNYLISFMNDFSYDEKDAAFLLASYDQIIRNEDTKTLFDQCIARYNEDYLMDINTELLQPAEKECEKIGVHPFTTGLLLYICLSKHLKELYIEKGISLDIFHNSMLDLKYKEEECKLVRNVIGAFTANWFAGFFNLTRFALGRLQFEVRKFNREYNKNGHVLTPDSPVINIHIPRTGTPLDKKSCDEAYAMAKEFFKDQVNPCVFMCSSWLLYPAHLEFLSPKSNVYRFMSEFDIIDSGYCRDDQNLWRLFDTDEKNPDRLPTDNFLRKAYVDHLKKGGRTGWGAGIMFK